RVRMVRNALIAAGNSGDAALVAPVVALLGDSEPMVRGAAIWALAQLDPARHAAERAMRIACEPDAGVLAEWRLADAPLRV
ncbi:MAG: HEAT repeat domain-containing protein, partial [Sphingomonas sp.]